MRVEREIAKAMLWVTVAAGSASLLVWRATGGDAFTKFEAIEIIQRPVQPDDPLAGTAFYDSNTVTETIRIKQFRLGLLPGTPRLTDKHALSVVTVTAPLGVLTLLSALWARCRKRPGSGGTRTG
jgi:hypothetical protein